MRTSLITLLLVCGLQALFFGPAALGSTLAVPAPYTTIQSAINAAVDGDVIVVASGTYSENIDFLGKAITLRSSDGPAVTTINGSGTGSVVQCVSGEGPGTVLEGFTITGGNANNGGGMLNLGTSPTVNNCIFESNNAADRGGGMYNRLGNPTITATIFRNNSSVAMGGGVFNIEGASPTISDCLFEGNTSNKGGGMRNYRDSHPTVTNTVFSYNHAGEEGGGMDNRKNSNAFVMNCTFIGNSAGSGGMHNYVGNAIPTGNPTIVNSLFIGNIAPSGAGMRNNDPSPTITNSTFAYNDGPAIRSRSGSIPLLTNCIVWGNSGGSFTFTSDSVPVVTYSNIEGGFTGTGNVDSDPLFADPDGLDGDPATLEDNDYRLLSSSPSVDSGSNLAPALPLTDLDGNPRIAAGTLDMGPYEFSETCTISADCDDGSLCTTDTCSEGACINTPVCDDADACTLNSCDVTTGACSFPPNSCDDGVACTTDSCDVALGCLNAPLECAALETCVGGACVLPLCDDNGVCEAGEDCFSCPNDCAGKQKGSLSNRFCCGDLTCQSAEDSFSCAVDCGAPSSCGDGVCDFGEDSCSCQADCGSPLLDEVGFCSDGADNDCDLAVDCQDSDCSGIDPACAVCIVAQVGETCTVDEGCCSGKCRGPKNNQTCR